MCDFSVHFIFIFQLVNIYDIYIFYFQRECYSDQYIACLRGPYSSRRGRRMGKKIARLVKLNKDRKVNEVAFPENRYAYLAGI